MNSRTSFLIRAWSEVSIDRAVYRDGRRTAEPGHFAELHAACQIGDAIAWLGLYEPGKDEFAAVAHEYCPHELAVEDAIKAHQRPKLERYGNTLFRMLEQDPGSQPHARDARWSTPAETRPCPVAT